MVVGLVLSAYPARGDTNCAAMNTTTVLREQLKVGMTKEDAIKVLQAHHIDYGFVPVADIQGLEVPNRSKAYYRRLKGRLMALLRTDCGNRLIKESITIEVDLDHGNQVFGVHITPVYTGP